MTRLRSLIKEALSTPPKKKDCNCGCGGCAKKAPILTEGKVKKILSEGLQYHIDKKVPLHESVYRIGSEKHFALINEARTLWVRGLIDVSEDDQAILETHLGNFGMYEGEEVPLDMPMVNEDMGEWPKELTSRYSDEYRFELEKVTPTYQDKPGRAKYRVIDIESGELKATPVFGTPESLMAFADDLIKPQGGTQSSGFGESLNEDIYDKFLDDPQSPKGRAKAIISKFIKQYGEDASGMAVDRFVKQNNLKPEEKYILQYITKNDISISSKPGGPDFSALSEATRQELGMSSSVSKSRAKAALKNPSNDGSKVYGLDKDGKRVELKSINDIDKFKKFEIDADLNEAKKKSKKKDPPLNKPKRGGSKAYYVYVRDPKTKKIKKVSFGSGGLRAKIKNKQARNAFAARHNCKNKKDRTKAGYWSCNLPRYADQLGLGSKMNTFW